MILFPKLINTYRGIECEYFYSNSFRDIVHYKDLFSHSLCGNELRIVCNFNIVFSNIVEWLLKYITYPFDIKDNYIQITYDKTNIVTICGYETKYMDKFQSFERAQFLESKDIFHRPTCAQDSKYEYMNTIKENHAHAKNIFNIMYPTDNESELYFWKECKKVIKPAIYSKNGIYNSVYYYDIKASYTSTLYNNRTPFGHGIYTTTEKVPKNYWYIKRIRLFDADKKEIDIMRLNSLNYPCDFYVTPETEYIINEYYKAKYNYIDSYIYKTKISEFDEFIENSMNYSDVRQKKTQKAKINLLVGTFGARNYIKKQYLLKNDNLIIKELYAEKAKAYYPIWIFVVANGLLNIYQKIKNHLDDIYYINTDGILCNHQLYSTQNILGNFELRRYYLKINIKNIGDYIGEYLEDTGQVKTDVVMSGRIYYKNDIYGLTEIPSYLLYRNNYGFISARPYTSEDSQR